MFLLHLLEDVEPRTSRHRHVEQYDVPRVATDLIEGIITVSRLSDNEYVRIIAEDLLQSLADNRMVVGDQHTDGHDPLSLFITESFRSYIKWPCHGNTVPALGS